MERRTEARPNVKRPTSAVRIVVVGVSRRRTKREERSVAMSIVIAERSGSDDDGQR